MWYWLRVPDGVAKQFFTRAISLGRSTTNIFLRARPSLCVAARRRIVMNGLESLIRRAGMNQLRSPATHV